MGRYHLQLVHHSSKIHGRLVFDIRFLACVQRIAPTPLPNLARSQTVGDIKFEDIVCSQNFYFGDVQGHTQGSGSSPCSTSSF